MKKREVPQGVLKLAYMAEEALRLAVYEEMQDHARTGDRVAIWKNDRVVLADPRKLKLRRPPLKYLSKKEKRNRV